MSYANDPLNRQSVTENGVTTSYTPNGMNQYSGVSGHTLGYDGNWNLSGYDGWIYSYDAENRLIAATGPGGQSAQFVYDGLGRCVKRTQSTERAP